MIQSIFQTDLLEFMLTNLNAVFPFKKFKATSQMMSILKKEQNTISFNKC